MNREALDKLQGELKASVDVATSAHVFPLNAAVHATLAQHQARVDAARARPDVADQDLRLLELFDITSVSAALAIRALSKRGDDASGIATALVDLWTQSEAARCLWFDRFSSTSADDSRAKGEAIRETAKLLAPEAIAVAIRMRESATQYVEFVSKVV